MNKLKRFFQTWPEAWALPLMIAGLIIVGAFLQWLTPTVSTFDYGIFQRLELIALVTVLTGFLGFLGFYLNFPGLFQDYISKRGQLPTGDPLELAKLRQWYILGFLLIVAIIAHGVMSGGLIVRV
jgi:hypothetical protein